jgi:hypothetical protein
VAESDAVRAVWFHNPRHSHNSHSELPEYKEKGSIFVYCTKLLTVTISRENSKYYYQKQFFGNTDCLATIVDRYSTANLEQMLLSRSGT